MQWRVQLELVQQLLVCVMHEIFSKLLCCIIACMSDAARHVHAVKLRCHVYCRMQLGSYFSKACAWLSIAACLDRGKGTDFAWCGECSHL